MEQTVPITLGVGGLQYWSPALCISTSSFSFSGISVIFCLLASLILAERLIHNILVYFICFSRICNRRLIVFSWKTHDRRKNHTACDIASNEWWKEQRRLERDSVIKCYQMLTVTRNLFWENKKRMTWLRHINREQKSKQYNNTDKDTRFPLSCSTWTVEFSLRKQFLLLREYFQNIPIPLL